MIIKNTHPYIETSKQLNSCSLLLKKINVTCFSYIKNFNNGKQIYLSTQPKWVEDYYNLELYDSSDYEAEPVSYETGISLWSPDSGTPIRLHGRDYYNSNHGITIINKFSNHCEFFFFSGPANRPKMQEFFVNNIDLLEHFILFFKDKFHCELKKLEKCKNPIVKESANNIQEKQINITTHSKRAFLEGTQIRQLTHKLNSSPVRFSTQQTACIRALLENKTLPEIAHIMNLSKRTVESYVDAIKNKLNCHSLSELLHIVRHYKNKL